VLVSLGAACGRQESASTETVGGAGGAAESGGGGARPDYEALYECAEDAFSDVRELGGEGYDPEVGILGEPQEKYLVSTTLIYWRPELTDEFYQMGGDVMGQLVSTPGLVAWALGTDEVCHVGRALTVWRSEEDMYAFVVSGAHGEAVGMTLDLSYTGKSTHWWATADELGSLDWELARAKLAEVDVHPIYE
jgi:heme-degrading monooxygenase HmoA